MIHSFTCLRDAYSGSGAVTRAPVSQTLDFVITETVGPMVLTTGHGNTPWEATKSVSYIKQLPSVIRKPSKEKKQH